jgi:multiple sugar transport system ATP-binding protein
MANIRLEGLTKKFADGGDTVVAVDGLDLNIRDGEFVVFVGPSGCGKTTTLRCIAGLETVTEGEIRLEDEVITDTPPEDRDLAMVFQSYALYPHMTVRQNMMFGLQYATDMTSSEIESRVADVAEMMDIDELLDRRPADLSGGQQQRVALGRAIVRDPEAFLMDEPLSNLDAKLRAEMRTYLQQLQGDIGVTTIYVTHDQTEAMTMGDKIAILNDGRLQQFGTPADCYHRPQKTFVAKFLGEPSINEFPMHVEDGTLIAGAYERELHPEVRDDLPDGELTVCIRPENLEVANPGAADELAVRGTVAVVEHLGKESNVHVEVSDFNAELRVVVEGRPTFEKGDEVAVGVPEAAMHFFDPATGKVIRNAIGTGREARWDASPRT